MALSSKREFFEFPLEQEHKDKITELIDNEFDKYLKRHALSLTEKKREVLRRRVNDQLSEYMTELSDNKIRWSLASEVITIKVKHTNTDDSQSKIKRYSKKMQSNYRFIEKSNKWEYLKDTKTKGDKPGISYDEFVQRVYDELYLSATTAAFYGIASWFMD